MALYRTKLRGKSRSKFWERGANILTRWVKLENVVENATFILPKSCRVTGRIVIANRSANTQAAITVGTTAAGTNIDAGATTATLVTQHRNGTATSADNTADRTIYVESAAWQSGVHVLLEVEEWPVIADTTALS